MNRIKEVGKVRLMVGLIFGKKITPLCTFYKGDFFVRQTPRFLKSFSDETQNRVCKILAEDTVVSCEAFIRSRVQS